VGPLDPDGFPIGGHALVIVNAELRIPVRGGLGAVAFVDAGNVFLLVDDMDLSELRGAFGFGIRYRSPVGPIRVDLGLKMDRRLLPNGDRERPAALHISLGQAF
jgi:outer membrane translocation and assembly module TamA